MNDILWYLFHPDWQWRERIALLAREWATLLQCLWKWDKLKTEKLRQGIEYQLQYDCTGLGTCDQPWGHWLDYQVSFQFDIVETQLKGKFHAPLSRQSFNLDDS